jgi:hypothetical protein
VTHPARDIYEALELGSRGLTAGAIGELLDIPKATVRDWLTGRLPARVRNWGGTKPDPACHRCEGDPHRFGDLPRSYAYLLGLYLGDGCISTHPRSVYKLRIILDAAYPGIIAEAETAIGMVRPQNKVGKVLRPDHSVEVLSYSKAWPCLFPQHGPGKKHLRRIKLSPWQEVLVRREPELLLRGLIHSDGCRFMNTGSGNWRHARYVFSNFSQDIRRIFMDACDLMGLRWTTSRHLVYVSRMADVERMDEFIGPKT